MKWNGTTSNDKGTNPISDQIAALERLVSRYGIDLLRCFRKIEAALSELDTLCHIHAVDEGMRR
jgi:hypothetical protein